MLVGSVLNGYRVIEKLVEMPETILYKGVHEQNLHEVAIKMLLPYVARRHELIRQLKREAYYQGRLTHTNIVKGRGFFRKPFRHHFIMDYFQARSMRSRLQDEQDTIVRKYLKKIMIDVGDALAYVHSQGVVHRDVKPENIIINSAGDAKLIDFALASRYDILSRTFVRRKVQGTRSYMAPEQILGKAVDNRADVYSYGATVFEMVAGHPPFTGATEAQILRRHLTEEARPIKRFKNNVTTTFNALVSHMLEKSPRKRPSSMSEVVEVLESHALFFDEPDGGLAETGVTVE
jgi:serine/threonine-protein kinase